MMGRDDGTASQIRQMGIARPVGRFGICVVGGTRHRWRDRVNSIHSALDIFAIWGAGGGCGAKFE